MGSCFSSKKKDLNAAAPVSLQQSLADPGTEGSKLKIKKMIVEEEEVKTKVEEASLVKKEIFVIKHRKSHDRPPQVDAISASTSTSASAAEMVNNSTSTVAVRTSSCTKEEVDAILIQCGRLSRSNSSGAAGKTSARKYCGSKRSYDFDHNDQDQGVELVTAAHYDANKKANDDDDDDDGDADADADDERRQHRQRQRYRQERSRLPSSSQGRRRTPSRERDPNQRSGSRERSSSSTGSGRRVSRSPGRRSETTPSTNANNRPGKMVSVPPTVSSLAMDTSNNGVHHQTASTIKRISVKRNVAEVAARSAASPRSQSPARTNSHQQQQPSLSRSSSRKADQSPYRRNPLSEIDPNSLPYPQPSSNKPSSVNRVQTRNKEIEEQVEIKESINLLNQAPLMSKTNAETNSRLLAQGINCVGSLDNKTEKEQQQLVEDANGWPPQRAESSKPQTLTRSRSARRSRDLDINPEPLLNTTLSYTSLLLEDIQNFHQKNTSFSLPPCVTKACSILEAVADLNSTTSSNLSCTVSEDRSPPTCTVGANNLVGKKLSEAKDPFVESEILVRDDLMQPSFHKYVTVRRGGTLLCGEEMDGQESSGSNSYVAGSQSQQQHWGVSTTSSWEPNSADSTDRWTSRSNTSEKDEKSSTPMPLGLQRHAALPDIDMEEARRGFTGQRTGSGRGRVGTTKTNLHSTPLIAPTASR